MVGSFFLEGVFVERFIVAGIVESGGFVVGFLVVDGEEFVAVFHARILRYAVP